MGESLPDFPTVERLLSLLCSIPTYLHCRHGRDRTGAVVALYRTVVQGVSLAQVGGELLRQGFDGTLETLALAQRRYDRSHRDDQGLRGTFKDECQCARWIQEVH
jgi:Tyrosine phosphatase family